MKLAGRHAVITGGSQGFGYHIARHFLAEGASVLLAARTADTLAHAADALAAASKGNVHTCVCDVAIENDVDRLMSRAADLWRAPDILVNCAGVAGPRGPITAGTWNEWKDAIAINLHGTVYPSVVCAELMKANGGGKIINISGGGATKPLPHLSAYAASKAGMVRFTETLAMELKEDRIDVNAVAPGVLATRIMDNFLEVSDQLGKSYEAEAERQRRDSLPAFDLASRLCVYLASPESDGITGRLISAQWDPWESLHEHREDLDTTDIYTLRRIIPAERGKTWGEREV